MSDVMLIGVLRMPPELWSGNHLTVNQRHSRYIEAAERIEADAEKINQLQTKLAESESRFAEIKKYCEIAKNTQGWDDININLHFALDDLFHAIELRQQSTNGSDGDE